MSLFRVLVVVCVVAILGCGGGGEAVKPPDTTAKDQVKQFLEGVAERGAAGSEMGAIMERLKFLEETEPELAADLRKDAQSIMSQQNSPQQIKQKAKDMLQKLEGAKGG